jgi:putative DNA primase/helicase
VFADLPSQSLKDTGNFKAITGEDCIMIESKHKNGFSYKPFCTLVFSCNKIPKNYNDRSDAFFGRLIALRFDNTIPVEKQDRGLKEKLLKEIDGIMAWSLIGLKRLMANQWVFSETDRTRNEIILYKTESSIVLQFVQECCVVDSEAMGFRDELFDAFQEFKAHSDSKQKVSQIAFNQEVESSFSIARGQASGRRTWKGIKLL